MKAFQARGTVSNSNKRLMLNQCSVSFGEGLKFTRWLIVAFMFTFNFAIQAKESRLHHIDDVATQQAINKSQLTSGLGAPYMQVGQWHFALGMGYGKYENPRASNRDTALYFVPRIAYYGERFYFENAKMGYALLEKPTHALDFILDINEDGINFNDNSLLVAMVSKTASRNDNDFQHFNDTFYFLNDTHPRHLSYMGGVEYSYSGKLRAQINVLQDVSSVHNGIEGKFDIGKKWQVGHLNAALFYQLNYKSSELANYYYGLDDEDVVINNVWGAIQATEAKYKMRAFFTHQLQLQLSYPLSKKWSVVGDLRRVYLGNEMLNSPWIERKWLTHFFVGVAWQY